MIAAGMGKLITIRSVCLAEYGAIEGIAVLALGIVAYLYWSGFREKRELRRQRRALERRRRAKAASVPQK